MPIPPAKYISSTLHFSLSSPLLYTLQSSHGLILIYLILCYCISFSPFLYLSSFSFFVLSSNLSHCLSFPFHFLLFSLVIMWTTLAVSLKENTIVLFCCHVFIVNNTVTTSYLSVLLCVSRPLVSIYGYFLFLVKCDYWLIYFQLCVTMFCDLCI